MFAALPLAIKIGGPFALAAILAGAFYLYNERLRSEARLLEKQEFHEQIQEQAAKVQVHEEAQDVSRIEGLERLIAEKDRFNAAMLQENRNLKGKLSQAEAKGQEVIHDVEYVTIEKRMPCVVPNALVDRVDYLAGVLNAIPHDRVSGSPQAVAEPTPPGDGPVACLALVARIETLTSRLGNVVLAHRSLSEQAMKDYELYEAWKRSVKDPS